MPNPNPNPDLPAAARPGEAPGGEARPEATAVTGELMAPQPDEPAASANLQLAGAPSSARAYARGSTELIRAATPAARVEQAAAVATALKDVVVKQGLRTKVGARKVLDVHTGEPARDEHGRERWEPRWHPDVEAWQTLATMLGVALVERAPGPTPVLDPSTGTPIRRRFTVTERTYHPKANGGGLKAERTYEVDGHDWQVTYDVIKDGVVVGAASGRCSRSEAKWKDADEYAVIGMAQTRAESRAMRAVAAWVMAMAGYQTTPSEEMPTSAANDAVADERTGAPGRQPPAWAAEASSERKQLALSALTYLLDPAAADGGESSPAPGDAGGAGALATQVLTEIKLQLGAMPDAVPAVLIRAAGRLQRAAHPDAPSQPTPTGPAPDPARTGELVTVDFSQLGPNGSSGPAVA